jgi:hypothetical protein
MNRPAAVVLARRWWPAVLLAVIVVAWRAVTWMERPAAAAPTPAAGIASAASAAAPAGPTTQSDVAPASPPASQPVMALAHSGIGASAATRAAAPAGKAASAPRVMRVCGGAEVPVAADGNPDEAAVNALGDPTEMRREVLARLDASADELARAVADYSVALRSRWLANAHRHAADLAAAAASAASAAASEPFGDFQLPTAETPAVQAAAQARAERLVDTATATTDPRVYAMAMRLCRPFHVGPPPSCSRLSLAQWARLDPANAAVWLELFEDATSRRDTPAANEALHRMATATSFDSRYGLVAGAVVAHAPNDDRSALPAFTLAVEVVGLEAAFWLPGLQSLVAACGGTALDDTNRRETCSRVAELMAEATDTLITPSIATAIGRKLGWPQARLDAHKAELSQLYERASAMIDDANPLGCPTLKRQLDHLERVGRMGEIAALRNAPQIPPR